jgi:hypothetical protein
MKLRYDIQILKICIFFAKISGRNSYENSIIDASRKVQLEAP